MIELRNYQIEAVEAIEKTLIEDSSTLVAASVGAGKTIIQAEFFRRVMDESNGLARCLSLAHTRELVSQNAAAMVRLWPGAPVGINAAALGRRDTRNSILFASIQSVFKDAAKIGPFDVVCVDECDLIVGEATSQYGRLLRELFEQNPNMRLVGLSGTPFRLDSGWLHLGVNRTFESMCYEISIPDLIERGYLVPPINKSTQQSYDVSGVKSKGGDYVQKDLQERILQSGTTQRAVLEMVASAKDRKKWLVFCAGIDHAYAVRDAVRSCGITCETVEGTLSADERKAIFKRHRSGEVTCLTNVMVASVGYDDPGIDMVALMRPTESPRLYIQQVGRGLRCLGSDIHESIRNGKKDVLVLDFAGNIDSLGPVDRPMVDTKQKKDKFEPSPPPMKVCPQCRSYVFASSRECQDCGFSFPKTEIDDKISHQPSKAAILSDPLGWEMVTDVRFHNHKKLGGLCSLRAEFFVGKKSYSEYLCFDHPQGSYAQTKAAKWWLARGGDGIPLSVDEALDRVEELAPVGKIRIVKDGSYWRIASYKDKKPDEFAAWEQERKEGI